MAGQLKIAEASDFWQANSIEFAFEIYGLEKCCQKLDRNGGRSFGMGEWKGEEGCSPAEIIAFDYSLWMSPLAFGLHVSVFWPKTSVRPAKWAAFFGGRATQWRQRILGART